MDWLRINPTACLHFCFVSKESNVRKSFLFFLFLTKPGKKVWDVPNFKKSHFPPNGKVKRVLLLVIEEELVCDQWVTGKNIGYHDALTCDYLNQIL